MNIDQLPKHVAIIPDGNRRWARLRGLEPWEGHEAGSKNLETLIKTARNLGIRELSFWGSSLDNLKKRPIPEKKALLDIYLRYFGKLSESSDIEEDEVRVRFIGRWREQFPAPLVRLLSDIEEKTQKHSKHFLNFFLAYSGIDDMLGAFREMLSRGLSPKDVDEHMVKSCLMTQDIAPVDFLIRTGKGFHNSSGFLMWEAADSQLFFSEKLFPDFGAEDFHVAIRDFTTRERRFGK